MINNKSGVNFYLIALEFILFATSQITFRDCEVKFILLWHSKLNKRNWQKKASSSYFWCKANIVKHIREPLIDRNTILIEHPLQATNSLYDIVANCICTMLVSSIRRFSSFLSNYQVINLHSLFEETLKSERRTQRDLHDTTTIPSSHQSLGAQ